MLRLAPTGAKFKARRRYRRAKETKRGGRGGRKSECFIVPWKRGNRPAGPRGGKGAPEHGTVRGSDGGDLELHNYLNATRADSARDRQTVRRRAGCGQSARPDPWRPQGSNPPRLPDRVAGVRNPDASLTLSKIDSLEQGYDQGKVVCEIWGNLYHRTSQSNSPSSNFISIHRP